MYKTIRHGENSLQYTILPQQEDSNTASGGRRRGTILIITLVLACGIVGAAVVVPLLLSTDLAAFQRLKAHHRHVLYIFLTAYSGSSLVIRSLLESKITHSKLSHINKFYSAIL
ncbi:hypothetical protein L9F63_006042 [Diploptera punctata]|uniref:Uncharacterized protein n=1 Tax=Diploptera punctata TaxID=6984 RepID=A0AAD8E5K0_DIPPU|nr:hypothetical protein L9F63_006042 [Diploptera punctata]